MQIYQYKLHQREEDNTTPAVLVDVPSTATLTEENLEVNNDLLLTENQKERNTTYLAIKNQSFERQTGEICIPQIIFNSLCCRRTCSERTGSNN